MIDDHNQKLNPYQSQSWMRVVLFDHFSARRTQPLVYHICDIFHPTCCWKHKNCMVWLARLVKFNLSDPFMISSHIFCSFLQWTCSFGTDWSPDKLVHILKSWTLSHQIIKALCLFLRWQLGATNGKHLLLCWLPYEPAAFLSHTANMVLCLWHDISSSSRPAAELVWRGRPSQEEEGLVNSPVG